MVASYISMWGSIPSFLEDYLSLNLLTRLKKIGYFCGMDYASKDVYKFSEYVSRFDHSLSVALITWKYSKDKKATLAALFHDVATPIFSHVIDYMNRDFLYQESTEEKTYELLANNKELMSQLKKDNLTIEDLDFKKYNIVDNNRPKICADRLDGIIMTSLFWTKKLKIEEVLELIDDVEVFINENVEKELGFKTEDSINKIAKLNDAINIECHSNYDTFMMLKLADITKYMIDKKVISYDDLFVLTEEDIWNIISDYSKKDEYLKSLVDIFTKIKKKDIPLIKIPPLKNRIVTPIITSKKYFVYNISKYQFRIVEENNFIIEISLNTNKLNGVLEKTKLIEKTKEELEEYFDGKRKSFDIPYKLTGKKFQNKIWREIAKIKYGEYITYGDLAKKLGGIKYARAVGNACNKNNILIIIPCHRVLSKNGIGGFEYGVEMKQKLLKLEASN